MKALNTSLIALLLLTSSNIYAQHCDTATFQSKYWLEGLDAEYITKLIAQPSGNIVIVGGVTDTGHYAQDIGDINMTKLTQKGTVLWAKRLGYGGSLEWPYDAKGTRDGGFIFCGTTRRDNPHNDAWIVKLDANANIQWSIILTPQSGTIAGYPRNIIQLNDQGFAVAGEMDLSLDNNGAALLKAAFVAKLNKDGQLLWAKTFLNTRNLTYLVRIKELHDGNLVVYGGSHTWPSSNIYDGVGFLTKLSGDNGQPIWSNIMDEGYSGDITEYANNDIRLTVRNVIYDFDENGQNTDVTKFDLPFGYLDNKDLLHFAGKTPGEDYYLIKQIRNPILFKTINDSAVVWARSYNYQSNEGYLIETDDAIFANNAFYIGAAINSNFFPDSSYDTSDLPYVIKTNEQGITACSDTFSQTFSFTKPGRLPNQLFSFKEGPPLISRAAGMYSKQVVPHGVVDCAEITCCRDTVMYNKISICPGTNYTLPGGSTTDTAGIYTTLSKTSKGCDSVIFTNVSLLPAASVSLGDDTCLTSNNRIDYNLSSSGQVQYLWQDGNTSSKYTASQPGVYWVRATNACNTAVDSVTIYKDCDFPVYIPTAFTPNNDGLNDVFRIGNLNAQQLVGLRIYNRWGQLLFFTSNESDGWNGSFNGSPQPTAVYVYVVRYKNRGGLVRELKGTIALIR